MRRFKSKGQEAFTLPVQYIKKLLRAFACNS